MWFWGNPPDPALCQLALWWPCAPFPPPCPLACLQMGTAAFEGRGWAMRPWRINQKALLSRVFSSMLCLCVYPNALEDYLCWLGLSLICRSVWAMLERFRLLDIWYISFNAGGSWNLSGECSFDLFTACKQAYLVVLTVNVIVVFLILWCFFSLTFFF